MVSARAALRGQDKMALRNPGMNRNIESCRGAHGRASRCTFSQGSTAQSRWNERAFESHFPVRRLMHDRSSRVTPAGRAHERAFEWDTAVDDHCRPRDILRAHVCPGNPPPSRRIGYLALARRGVVGSDCQRKSPVRPPKHTPLTRGNPFLRVLGPRPRQDSLQAIEWPASHRAHYCPRMSWPLEFILVRLYISPP